MQNHLKTLRQSLCIIQQHLNSNADAKFTLRGAMLLVFILEHPEPASYPDIKQHTGIEQTKAVDMASRLISYGVITKTVNKAGLVAYTGIEQGLLLKESLIKKLGEHS